MNYRYKILWKFPRLTIIIFLLFYTINFTSAQTTLPAEDIAEKALASTVYLEMKDTKGKTLGIGSGFFVKTNIIATNYHVIEGAAKGTAKLVGKNTTYDIEGITAFDRDNDLALLKVTASGIKPLSLGDSDKVRIGETVYVAGNPKGLEGTFSDGIISSRRDGLTKERLQMTAPISPGSSGGPVLNRKGEVIGVSFAVYKSLDAQNLNFAIPSKYLKKLLEQSKSTKPLSQGNPSIFSETFSENYIQRPPHQVSNSSISAETYLRWGNIKYKTGDYVGAVANYTKAIQLKPDHVYAYHSRGLAKGKLGRHAAAIVDYDIAIQLKPEDVMAYYNRGNAKVRLRRHFAAISDYDEAIRLKPNYAKAYHNRGIVKADLGQHAAAIADYDAAIRLKPYLAEAYNSRGNAKADLRQHVEAIADYGIAIHLRPDYADAYNNRGLAKGKLKQYTAAIADYDIAIRLRTDFAEAYFNRGFYKGKLKQYTAAISDYDIAIRLRTDFTKAYTSRGIAKYHLGRMEEARQDLQKASKLAEKDGYKSLKTKIESLLQKIR